MINIGEQLHSARTAKQLSIEEASAQTKVSATVLNRYENNDFGAQPLTVYTKGHVKLYCQILGLDPTTIVDALQQQYAEHHTDQVNHEPRSSAATIQAWLSCFKQRVNFTHFVLLLLLGGWIAFIVYASHSSARHIPQSTTQKTTTQKTTTQSSISAVTITDKTPQIAALPPATQQPSIAVPALSKTNNENSND